MLRYTYLQRKGTQMSFDTFANFMFAGIIAFYSAIALNIMF